MIWHYIHFIILLSTSSIILNDIFTPSSLFAIFAHTSLPCSYIGDFSVSAAAAMSLQSCLTPRHPIDGSPPGSSVHGIFQVRVLESGAAIQVCQGPIASASRWKVGTLRVRHNLETEKLPNLPTKCYHFLHVMTRKSLEKTMRACRSQTWVLSSQDTMTQRTQSSGCRLSAV